MPKPIFARLVNPNHKLPMPGLYRYFGRDWRGFLKSGGVECVDGDDPFWRLCLTDGSLEEVPAPPDVGDKFAPKGKLDVVREAFGWFGLEGPGDSRWTSIERAVELIARAYNFLTASPNPLPKTTQTPHQLKKLATRAEGLAKAIEGLNDPAIEWLLAYDNPFLLYARSREGGERPGQAPKEFVELRNMALKDELTSHAEKISDWTEAWIGTATEAWIGVAEAEQVGPKTPRSELSHQYMFPLVASPAPYSVRDQLAARNFALATLAGMAHERASAHGARHAGNKHSRKLHLHTPTEWIALSIVDVIERAFGVKGLEKITASRASKDVRGMPYVTLLRRIERYATGRQKSADFSDALEAAVASRDEKIRKLGASPRRRGRKGRATS